VRAGTLDARPGIAKTEIKLPVCGNRLRGLLRLVTADFAPPGNGRFEPKAAPQCAPFRQQFSHSHGSADAAFIFASRENGEDALDNDDHRSL
jgi:hypothetical protein